MENVYANVLCIKLMSLSRMNVNNISEQLKKNLNGATIITPCHFFLLFHLFRNTLRTYKIKLRYFQKQDSTFMQDKRLLQMLHRHIDILRYIFIIDGWLES